MASKLLQGLAALLAAAALVWLGYTIGRTQNINSTAQLQRDADTDRYTLTRAGTVVDFERLGGGGKPLVLTSDGLQLLDFSDWDLNSRIYVDGTAFDLSKLSPHSSVDYDRYQVAEALTGGSWFVEREISLDAQGVVHVAHTFVARTEIHRVDLTVAHVHSNFIQVTPNGDSLVASLSRVERDQAATGPQAPVAYRLHVQSEGPGPAISYRVGEFGLAGTGSFIGRSSIDNPAVDQRVPLGGESISIEPVRI